MLIQFPPVELADDSGLLAIGGELTVANLEQAYRRGVFPWPVEDYPIFWFAPPRRGILEFADLRISRRLHRYFKASGFEFCMNHDFPAVIRACARTRNRKGQSGTWLTPNMIEAYIDFHKVGFAHSFEVYAENELVGGLYGVRIGRYFAGESMFYWRSHASKFALIRAVDYLSKEGLTWMDVQVISPHLKRLGAHEISRRQFMARLSEAVACD